MAITKYARNTVHLAGRVEYINEVPAIEAITPGMVLEYHNDSGVLKLGVHDSADDPVDSIIALEQTYLNKGINDPYAAEDQVLAAIFYPGSVFFGIVPSGQNLNPGDRLQSNADGKLKALDGGVGKFIALEGTGGAVTEDTRVPVEVQPQ